MTQENEISAALLSEALDWLLELNTRPACRETQEAFRVWLSRSELHRKAWDQAEKTWQLLGEVPPVHESLWKRSDNAVATTKAARRRPRIWHAVAAMAAAACLAALFATPSLLLSWQADYITRAAETMRLTLEDGTVIEMSGDSAIVSDITPSSRRVTLLAGEAFFDVTHDESRPFVVNAGDVAISVLGTVFDVQLGDAETTVELARGRVALSYEGTDRKQTFELSSGEMATVDHSTGAVMRNAIAQEDIAAWRTGKMFVHDITVAAAVERLQRYHSAWITLADPTLASRRVTGLYNLMKPDEALQALVRPFGGKVRRVTSYGRVLTRF